MVWCLDVSILVSMESTAEMAKFGAGEREKLR